MNCWWERNAEVDLGDHTKKKVEDFTGCIPLFLKNCVMKGEKGEKDKINLETQFFCQVFDEAAEFEKNLQTECGHRELLKCVAVVLPI